MHARPEGERRTDDAARRLRGLVQRALAGRDPDLVEEVVAHLADRWVSLVGAGTTPQAADATIARELRRWDDASGAVPPTAPSLFTSGLWHDVRYSLRALRAHALLSGASILLVSLAVLANVCTFAVVYGVLWRPLPYPDPGRLAVLWQWSDGPQQVSFPDYLDLSAAPVFERAAAFAGGRGSLRVGTEIARVNAIEIEAAGYTMLGARPALGRLLGEADAGTAHALISHRAWRDFFHRDPAIVGRQIWLSGRTLTVAGVLPAGFDFELPVGDVFRLERHDVWTVMPRTPQFASRRDVSTYQAIVRLTPGVTPAEAQRAVDATAARLTMSAPATNANRGFRLVDLREQMVAPASAPLRLSAVAAVLALLIALLNLVALRTTCLSGRSLELGIRRALGAGAFRIRRQLFVEHLALIGIGTVAGTLAAVPALRAVAGSEALHLPRADAIRLDAPVLCGAAALSLLMALLLTALPASPAFGAGLRHAGRLSGARSRRSRRALIAAEVALALVLASGGALFGLSLTRLVAVDPGFTAHGVVTMRVSAYQERYPALDDVEAFVGRVLQRVSALPGVSGVAAGSSLPLSGQTSGTGVIVQGKPVPPAGRQHAGWQFVTPGYFEALGMRVVRGRDFTAEDRPHGGHVTIVNEALAGLLFGDEDPIGRRIASGDGDAQGDWHEIVGVVSSVRHHALDTAPAPRVYDLFGEHWARTLYVAARTPLGDPDVLLHPVRRAVAQVDPEVPAFETATMASLVARSTAAHRFAALAAAALAVCAALFAATGVYAVSAAIQLERARELGVRAALGASPQRLVEHVLADGCAAAMTGSVLGLAGAVVSAQVLRAQLFDVRATDAAILIASSAGVLLVLCLVSAVPAARRAAASDPLAVMRSE